MHMNSGIDDGGGQRNQPDFQALTLSASLTVQDLQKSWEWYQNVLGFTTHQKHEREGQVRAVSLQAGDVRILIGQDDGAKGFDRLKGKGISLMISTEQDIDAIANRIKEAGAALESEPVDTPWGARMFRVQDPDGFKLTISSAQGSKVQAKARKDGPAGPREPE